VSGFGWVSECSCWSEKDYELLFLSVWGFELVYWFGFLLMKESGSQSLFLYQSERKCL